MIKHVWTVLCDRVVIDQATNNVVLHAIEQLRMGASPPIEPGARVTVPFNLKVATLWAKTTDEAATGETRLTILGPDDEVLGESHHPLTVEQRRLRTFADLPVLVVTGSGIYQFVVELRHDGGDWAEVARLPLEVAVENDAGDGDAVAGL